MYIICPVSLLLANDKDLGQLANAITKGNLSFPDSVASDLERYYPGTTHATWAKLSKANTQRKVIDWEFLEQAQDIAPEILDPLVQDEHSSLSVLALALQERADGREPVVVTDDVTSTSIKTCLNGACGEAGIATLTFARFREQI